MVARKQDAEVQSEVELLGFLGRLLLAWRRLLTRLLFSVTQTIVRSRLHFAGTAETPWSERPWMVPTAILALLVGAVGAILVAPAGQLRELAAAASVASVVWAGLRLLLLRLAAARPARDPKAITGAWAVGLIAYGIGFTPALRFAAWAISGVLTWYFLQRLGEERREASVLTAVAWGTQAGVVVLSWLARNAYVAILAARG